MDSSYNLSVRLRLWSGLVLFAFLLSHLTNHSLGIHSLAWMEQGQVVFRAVWRSWPGTAILLAAALTHVTLGAVKVLKLPSWRMPVWEFIQIVLGLLILIQLVPHATGSRIAADWLGVTSSYALTLLSLWSLWAGPQIALVLIAWTHGCLGIHFWLRFRAGYARYAPWLLGAAVLVPALALLGFWNAGREVQSLVADANWYAARATAESWPNAETYAGVQALLVTLSAGTAAFVVLLVTARWMLRVSFSPPGAVSITYTHGPRVSVPRGTSILHASRMAAIPHASVCGGRGRCSTCRVRINHGIELLPPPNSDEREVLRRVGAPPNVRLACQVLAMNDLSVTLLIPALVHPAQVFSSNPHRHGREMEIAIVFTDLRGFTRLTQQKLAYDVVFLLNLYFRAMGEVIEAHQGHLVQVFGDGMMALFGIGSGAESGCRRALSAAKAMAERLDALNREHSMDLQEPLRMGIGVHCGPVIVGEMGYHNAVILTAVGDAVNTASRLQDSTKTFDCQLVVSEHAARAAGVDLGAHPLHDLDVRGRTGSLPVRAIPSAKELPEPAAPAIGEGPRLGAHHARLGH